MYAYYRNESAILLLLCACQNIITSALVMNYYSKNSIVKDKKYTICTYTLYLSSLSIIMSIAALFGFIVPIFYQLWVMLAVYADLVVTVLGIYILPGTNYSTILWIFAVAICIGLNGFATHAVIPAHTPEEAFQ